MKYTYDGSSDRVATIKRDGQNRFAAYAYAYDSQGNIETVQDFLNDITIRYVPADEGEGQAARVNVSNREETQLLYSYEIIQGDTESTLRTTIGSGDDAEVYELH